MSPALLVQNTVWGISEACSGELSESCSGEIQIVRSTGWLDISVLQAFNEGHYPGPRPSHVSEGCISRN
jgi:hypothetical protein